MKIIGGRIINDFIEPNKRQYSIPVYQRNYEWSREQCEKLFEDIVQAFKRGNQHFCGSIVYAPLATGRRIQDFVIVDGQQRITTTYILLKALIDCASTDSEKDSLEETVFNRDKYDEYDIDQASKLKLKPIKSDNQQLILLMDGKYDQMDQASGIWINYTIFKELIQNTLVAEEISVKDIYRGIERLTCADIRLDDEDNAQEIFERINSTGVPLSLSDQIRNYVLMTEVDQEKLYEDYWLKIEQLISKEQRSEYFLDYLNFKVDGFAREKTAYEDFKKLYIAGNYTNKSMLEELTHYATLFSMFVNGSDSLSTEANKYLAGLKYLNQSTVYLFLFSVFDDYLAGNILKQGELEKILQLLLTYSIRRIMCEVSSNSLRGMYKTLYKRIFNREENKEHYYDAIVSFLLQMTSRDVMPSDYDFDYALKNNNLFGKHALCRYLLIAIENSGKEKLATDNLSIEHIMPQNKNLSTSWQKMLGPNWSEVKDRWLHTMGNLTLTGYNSELGDKPFLEKKKLIEEIQTKVVILYKDVQDKSEWNEDCIKARAKRLAKIVEGLFTYEDPAIKVTFTDPRYKEYTCADPSNATYKSVNYYELIGERVITDSFADMVRSVTAKLYELDETIIEQMARNNECFPDWQIPAFSYDCNKVRGSEKIPGTDIYMISGFSAQNSIEYIRALLKKYDLNIDEEFVYSARSNKKETVELEQ